MLIRDMFQEDINRQINGVIKVEQSSIEVVEQEVKEYVITKELKKHFMTFFNYYNEAFNNPTEDIGVWISGFFGSGKSHFLKMLSYILANKKIGNISTVEAFRNKFEEDPGSFMLIDEATKNPTETILFNIDIEGPITKDKTAVLRVFAKMFYNHLGFYGDDLKVAKLEQFIAKKGKMNEFQDVFRQKNGEAWMESRGSYAFFEDDVVSTLQEVLGMSEVAARNWFNGIDIEDYSIKQLVAEISEYVKNKPDNFRFLFMIDEVGQYVGEETDYLLNLQSIVEELGSKCLGKVWVICTGQEAVDEVIKVREHAFSRIQARFKTRLSLTSSSVDEVVQKRILKKKKEVIPQLEDIYNKNDSVLKNLFTFTESVLDIKGYSGSTEFIENYPFVPYQFLVMQKVFNEIRKHGNVGRHQSNGERSMLSGFQETVQNLQNRDDTTLAPFYMFYDTLHAFLDSSIRRVIERCDNAAKNGDGIEVYDVSVLKLLYLIRYIDNDIKSTLDNIVILMADKIDINKIDLREKVRNSLNRLLSQNYIGRSGDSYNFLTDEEQDIQKEIEREQVDTATLRKRIGEIIYGSIYESKKFRYGKYDFSFAQMIDEFMVSNLGDLCIQFITIPDESEFHLINASINKVVGVLSETAYYTCLEHALKIRNYVMHHNVAQMPKSMQNIIIGKQTEASKYEQEACDSLLIAVEKAEYYVHGSKVQIPAGNAKNRIDQAFELLVSNVYTKLGLIEKNIESDDEIRNILLGAGQQGMIDFNRSAAAEVEEFLQMKENMRGSTSMSDIQSRYQARPYGWKEIDIAAVVALLIRNQKVTVKYSGNTIQPNNKKLVEMLRKRNEASKTNISKRHEVSEFLMSNVKALLRDYFGVMDLPDDEDGLISYIIDNFIKQDVEYKVIYNYYKIRAYPNKAVVEQAINMIQNVLMHKNDNTALITFINDNKDALLDIKDEMIAVKSFFNGQVKFFDAAAKFEEELQNDLDYLSADQEAIDALNKIRLIISGVNSADYVYKNIPSLEMLMATVKVAHNKILAKKRANLNDFMHRCMEEIHIKAEANLEAKTISDKADLYYGEMERKISTQNSLAILDSYIQQMLRYNDDSCGRISAFTKPKNAVDSESKAGEEVIKTVYRQFIFPAKCLKTDDDLQNYLNDIKMQLSELMKGIDGIDIK